MPYELGNWTQDSLKRYTWHNKHGLFSIVKKVDEFQLKNGSWTCQENIIRDVWHRLGDYARRGICFDIHMHMFYEMESANYDRGMVKSGIEYSTFGTVRGV